MPDRGFLFSLCRFFSSESFLDLHSQETPWRERETGRNRAEQLSLPLGLPGNPGWWGWSRVFFPEGREFVVAFSGKFWKLERTAGCENRNIRGGESDSLFLWCRKKERAVRWTARICKDEKRLFLLQPRMKKLMRNMAVMIHMNRLTSRALPESSLTAA